MDSTNEFVPRISSPVRIYYLFQVSNSGSQYSTPNLSVAGMIFHHVRLTLWRQRSSNDAIWLIIPISKYEDGLIRHSTMCLIHYCWEYEINRESWFFYLCTLIHLGNTRPTFQFRRYTEWRLAWVSIKPSRLRRSEYVERSQRYSGDRICIVSAQMATGD